MSLVYRVTRSPKVPFLKTYNKTKSVSVRQMVLMVNFLEGHRYLACGNLRRNKKNNPMHMRLWAKCAKILNADPEGDPRSANDWKKWFLHYKSRLLLRISRNEVQHGADENSEALPMTALEAQFAAVCGADMDGGLEEYTENNTNSSIGSASDPSSDEQNTSRDSDSEREKSPITSQTNDHRLAENRFHIFGKIVALKLQNVGETQRVIAEKVIMDAIFMAESGSLTMDHAYDFVDVDLNT